LQCVLKAVVAKRVTGGSKGQTTQSRKPGQRRLVEGNGSPGTITTTLILVDRYLLVILCLAAGRWSGWSPRPETLEPIVGPGRSLTACQERCRRNCAPKAFGSSIPRVASLPFSTDGLMDARLPRKDLMKRAWPDIFKRGKQRGDKRVTPQDRWREATSLRNIDDPLTAPPLCAGGVAE